MVIKFILFSCQILNSRLFRLRRPAQAGEKLNPFVILTTFAPFIYELF